jgi:hypothetical protein
VVLVVTIYGTPPAFVAKIWKQFSITKFHY